ncbi:MAG TPA: cytochrome ubiquinol oxidase subunit I [Planctomycetota bacterium]|nr:cytochrome ubiquinol oxidase subunit I [Planctomycetota bacterium]
MSAASRLLAVDPVPWARAQMAFTLAVHSVLVPHGVSWAFMALVAHARGLRHGDADALRLARHWSKCMAVTFAVGAVTGTVLTFEFGLLWPHFMHRFGPAFGIPFAIEGLFFFTEAIFIAIYIYGWKGLPPGCTSRPACPWSWPASARSPRWSCPTASGRSWARSPRGACAQAQPPTRGRAG